MAARHRLQRFKLNIASSVVTQQNASLSTMGTDQVLDLFQLSSTDGVATTKQADGEDKPMSNKAMLASLGDLADQDHGDLGGDALSFAAAL
jgi:TATA-binding protein-associated factor